MKEADIAKVFRQQEIARRDARRQMLLNEASLLDEEAKHPDYVSQAYQRLAEQNGRISDAAAAGRATEWWFALPYWKRVWVAVSGKPPFPGRTS